MLNYLEIFNKIYENISSKRNPYNNKWDINKYTDQNKDIDYFGHYEFHIRYFKKSDLFITLYNEKPILYISDTNCFNKINLSDSEYENVKKKMENLVKIYNECLNNLLLKAINDL